MPKEKYVAILKENGLKVTDQRIMILKTLDSERGKHLTSEEIYDIIKQKYPQIGIATVYRNIQVLRELRIIDELNLNDGFVRYEMSRTKGDEHTHNHHHLVCIKCGAIISFEDDLLEPLELKIKEEKGFCVINHDLKFYGICFNCEKNNFS